MSCSAPPPVPDELQDYLTLSLSLSLSLSLCITRFLTHPPIYRPLTCLIQNNVVLSYNRKLITVQNLRFSSAMTLKMTVIWDVRPCSLVNACRFTRTCFLYHQRCISHLLWQQAFRNVFKHYRACQTACAPHPERSKFIAQTLNAIFLRCSLQL